MNPVFKTAGACVAGGLLFGWSMMKSGENFDKMAAHYSLNQPQIEFARSCMSSLSSFDKEFRGGAKSHVGCGCMATKLADGSTAGAPINYDQMGNAFYSVAKYSETNDGKATDIAGMFQHMTETQGLTYGDAMLAASELGRVVDACKSARLPKANAVALSSSNGAPYQPTATDAPTNAKGCEGLSASSIETLQKIADRDGKTLEEMCSRVVS